MLRLRLGSTWRQDPALRAALTRGGAEAREAVAGAIDALVIEVDGIDVGAGRAEGPLVAGVEALGDAVLRLLGGAPRASVHFAEGQLEVVLARRGASALLTVVGLARPARVLARDVEVDLAELARASRDLARGLADDLGTFPAAAVSAGVRSLRQLAERLERAPPRPPPAAPAVPDGGARPVRPRARAPACTFELHDDDGVVASYPGGGADLGSLLAPGTVTVRTVDGVEIAVVESPPFLAFRDLVAFARRIAEAVRRGEQATSAALAGTGRRAALTLEVELRAGTISRDGGAQLPCPPLLLARALCEGALDLCGVLAARNALQLNNGWLAELRGDAAECLAYVQELIAGDAPAGAAAPVQRRRARRLPGAPLGPGRVRRLTYRRAWAADVGAPAGEALALVQDLVIACGERAVLGVEASSGTERWRRPGVGFAAVHESTVLVADAERLYALDAPSGRERWSAPRSALPEGEIRGVVRMAGGLALALGSGSAVALQPGGAVAWTFSPPAALQLRALALGPLVVVGSDAGFLYGLEAATGRTVWRLRVPGPLTSPPTAYADSCLALCETDIGGSLLAVDPSTGRRRFEIPLDVTPAGSPVPFAGLVAIAGAVAGDPVVIATHPAGALAWENAPALASGPLALAPLASGLLAKTPRGACVALDRDGETVWSRLREAPHPPPASVPPVVGRGIALVPGEHVDALDAATGRLLGQVPIPAPVRLVADPALNVWGMDPEGAVTAARLETHLSVV